MADDSRHTATRTPIVVIGAGLAGPLLTLGLLQRGWPVRLFERRPDPRRTPTRRYRSINLAISARGIAALEAVGLWDTVRPLAVTMKGRMIHAVDGTLSFQPYGRNDAEVLYSISRAALHAALLDAVDAGAADLRFETACADLDTAAGIATLRTASGEYAIDPSPIIATDGASSVVRCAMARSGLVSVSQIQLAVGYKELHIPSGPDGEQVMEPHALHIWPRGDRMLVALPNIDGSFSAVLFLPHRGPESFGTLDEPSAIGSFFRTQFPDAAARMPRLAEEYAVNPVGSLSTINCWPWCVGGTALLLGDAAHAMVPFLGQGMNCAFEDCTCLLETIDHEGAAWSAVFHAFETQRKADTDAVSALSLDNFREMSESVSDPRFLLRKQVELALESRYPTRFVPGYSMITFHRVPYAVARSRAAVQERLLERLCRSIHAVDALDWPLAHELIHRELTPLAP